ncbi:histidine kinase [Streptomyces sp. NPDC088124]|uniref:sensor histidine kinase n=1 Tax=Streptomyces sp. NPDC088124 TaxID=3154654 RepID=UPI0034303E31
MSDHLRIPYVTEEPPATGALRAGLRRTVGSAAYPWVTGAVLTGCAAVELWVLPNGPTVSTGTTISAGVLVSTATLMWRRALPAVAIVTVASSLISFAASAHSNVAYTTLAAFLIGCYTLGRQRVQHPVLIVGGGTLAALAVNLLHIRTWQSTAPGVIPAVRSDGPLSAALASGLSPGLFAETFVVTATILGAVSAGDAVRAREETRRERTFAHERLIAMERRRAAEAERAAIARELHDVVSHSVSMIAVQAESASYTTPGLSPQARTAFQDIAGTARTSMAELRRLLGVLRTRPEGQAATAPQPTLDRLDELLEQHRAVGGEADLRVTGARGHAAERGGLPASWELSAYRIVQEALTNARRHAPGARTLVEIGYLADRLSIRVSDDGPGPAAGRSRGHGLVGMEERAALLGGRLTAGPGPDGGFLVEAELPW